MLFVLSIENDEIEMIASNVSCFVPARYDTFETETEIDWWSPVVMSRCFPRRLYAVACLGLLLCLLAGAIALLIQISNSRATMPGSDPASVVGPPTLSAATVDAIFADVGSPMYGTGKVVEQAARQANIDDAFALGVWWVETNDGAAGVGSADHNPGSVKASGGYPVAFDGYTIYPSYSAAILDWFNVLKARYISRGLTTVYAISYPYVGTSSSPLWAGKVVALMQRYRAEAPPPTPTPLPKPLYPASGQQKSKAIDQTRESAPPTVVPSVPRRQPAAAPAPLAAPTLALATRDAILLFGLLTALALALYALALDGKLTVLSRARPATNSAVTTEALHRPSTIATPIPASHSASLPALELSPVLAVTAVTAVTGQEPVRQTDALSPLEHAPARFLPRSPLAPSLGLPALNSVQAMPHSPATGSLRARVTLRPASEHGAAPEPEPVPVAASGSGLLSRYRRMQQYGDVSL